MLRLSQWLKGGLQASAELLKIVGMLTAMLFLVLPFAVLWIALFFKFYALFELVGVLLWVIMTFIGLSRLRRYLIKPAQKSKRKLE